MSDLSISAPALPALTPLRFALVTTFYPPFSFGGDGIYVQSLARALVARGHHVEVIHDTNGYRSMTGTDPELPVVPNPADDGIIVHRLRSKHPLLAALQVQQFGKPGVHRAEIAELLGDRFDVIHTHNISLIGGPGIWELGSAVKLHTAHEHWMVCASHILWRDNREVCDERHCLRCVLNHKRPPQLWRATGLLERAAKNVDAFLMLSESSADNHRRFGFTPPMTVVPSFLPNAPPLAETAKATVRSRPYFLFVGRLEVIKGLQDVIPQFTADLDADLLIAGTGDYEPELRRLAQGRANVHFLGRLGMDELRVLYRDARAVLTPSRCFEVFPLVVLEAFRESTPIIARDLGPYPEIVRESGGGLLFGDDQSLRAALDQMISDSAQASKMGADAFETYQRTWTEDMALAAYFQTIRAAALAADRLKTAQTCGLWIDAIQ
jgi:glycosyltransferase involved in cell wall biosynthesis